MVFKTQDETIAFHQGAFVGPGALLAAGERHAGDAGGVETAPGLGIAASALC